MAGIAEIGALAAETMITFAPWLVDIPVLGRILIALSPHGGNDLKAMEELQKLAEKKKTDRKDRISRNGRYVLKASDAMRCVEDNLMNGGVLLAIGKSLLDVVMGRSGGGAPDLLADRIFTCIEEHVLRQDTPRVKRSDPYFGRPARGHGHGRKR